MAYDLSTVKRRVQFGTYMENYLLTKLNNQNLNLKKSVNTYCFFDFIRKDTSLPLIVVMKSIINKIPMICLGLLSIIKNCYHK